MVVNGSGQITASGTDLGAYLGAGTFYSRGYTGSRATVASLEGGLAWSGHQSLTNIKYVPLTGGAVGITQAHATAVASIIGGRGGRPLDIGIAYGATVASGSVATNSAFSLTEASVAATYYAAANGFTPTDGSAAIRANVINGSWGLNGGYVGTSVIGNDIDGIAKATGALMVFAAGNSGPNPQTVAEPATSLNVMAVASLGSTTSPEISPNYTTVSTFSSRSPTPILLPNMLLAGTRAAISIAAPGESYSVASYNGPGTVPNWYTFNSSGTSFAAPTVAGAAALLVDVGKDRYAATTGSTDARVLRAVLMNSADKIPGWDNGEAKVNGVVKTTQALDYSTGSGALDIGRSFTQYTGGTHGGVSPLAGIAAPVADVGWNFATVPSGGSQMYGLAGVLPTGSMLTATLCWFADATYNPMTTSGSLDGLINLALEVDRVNADSSLTMVALSDTQYNPVEHLYFALPDTAQYILKVNYVGQDYGPAHATDYALAWNVAVVPEPVGAAFWILTAGLLVCRRSTARA